MSGGDLIPVLLLTLLSLSFAAGGTVVLFVVYLVRKGPVSAPRSVEALSHSDEDAGALAQPRPSTWLVILGRSLRDVQMALRLHNPKSCPCAEGLNGEQGIFIAPPSGRWTLVTGWGLPEPGDDIDFCFRFIQRLSLRLGTVQYFSSDRMKHHHAWVWCERGRVIRAYAWIGYTAWNQGLETSAERCLGVRCLPYSAPTEPGLSDEFAVINAEKVPVLASRWGADPATIFDALREPACGVAGDPFPLD